MPLRERRKGRSKGSVGLKKEEEEGCKPKPKRLRSNQNKEQKNSSRNVVVQYRLKTKKIRTKRRRFESFRSLTQDKHHFPFSFLPVNKK